MANNSDYRISSTGHGVALWSLTVCPIQPTAEAVQATRRTFAATGRPYDEGLYVEWVWSVIETPSQLLTVLGYFGMGGLPITYTKEVTIYTRNELYSYIRYNGLAVFPQLGRDLRWKNFFPRDLTMLIRDLEVAS